VIWTVGSIYIVMRNVGGWHDHTQPRKDDDDGEITYNDGSRANDND
jgi:hypothetical protein